VTVEDGLELHASEMTTHALTPSVLAPAAPTASSTPQAASAPTKAGLDWWGMIPFLLCHVVVFAAFWTGVTWQSVVLCIALYVARIFGVTAGYHRYFAHRTYETGRVMQFLLAFLAQTSAQRGVMWWAAHHRYHHLHSDDPTDRHSPTQQGFLESHMGWIFRKDVDATDFDRVKDLAKNPELIWLDRHWLVPPILLAVACLTFFGPSGLVIGFFLSTCLTWHGTYTINSLSHVFGKRRFETKDTSRNNPVLALITLGEGWHNNHHHYMNAARCGFYPHEIDLTYLGLCGLEKLGLVWGMKKVPARILEEGRARDAQALHAK
jgi:stearoyl-CoA desaturase (delta-9 desaturase)